MHLERPSRATCLLGMETQTQYREFAATCERLAREAKLEHRREVLMEMARVWRQLAGDADLEAYQSS